MPKSLFALLCGAVALLQLAIWKAAEARDQDARRLAEVATSVQGKVTLGEGQIIEGKSRYVVRYQFETAGGVRDGEEYFSMRQSLVPQKGEAITIFYDPSDPEWNTLTDPRVVVHRVATLKLLTLGFGAFTYAFIYVIWKNQKKEIHRGPTPV
jgi:hypothetical protein